jgi:hypothetical protein
MQLETHSEAAAPRSLRIDSLGVSTTSYLLTLTHGYCYYVYVLKGAPQKEESHNSGQPFGASVQALALQSVRSRRANAQGQLFTVR